VRASQSEALVSVTGHHYRLRGHLVFRNTKTARNRRLRLAYLAARRRPAAEAACIGCPSRSLWRLR